MWHRSVINATPSLCVNPVSGVRRDTLWQSVDWPATLWCQIRCRPHKVFISPEANLFSAQYSSTQTLLLPDVTSRWCELLPDVMNRWRELLFRLCWVAKEYFPVCKPPRRADKRITADYLGCLWGRVVWLKCTDIPPPPRKHTPAAIQDLLIKVKLSLCLSN
jgi:hypothetical protein